MLVLTRKIGEEIIINGEICVSVVRLRGNRVQIGIKAPAGVPIRRRELGSKAAPAPRSGRLPVANRTRARNMMPDNTHRRSRRAAVPSRISRVVRSCKRW